MIDLVSLGKPFLELSSQGTLRDPTRRHHFADSLHLFFAKLGARNGQLRFKKGTAMNVHIVLPCRAMGSSSSFSPQTIFYTPRCSNVKLIRKGATSRVPFNEQFTRTAEKRPL
jgi:hypothetical protein